MYDMSQLFVEIDHEHALDDELDCEDNEENDEPSYLLENGGKEKRLASEGTDDPDRKDHNHYANADQVDGVLLKASMSLVTEIDDHLPDSHTDK